MGSIGRDWTTGTGGAGASSPSLWHGHRATEAHRHPPFLPRPAARRVHQRQPQVDQGHHAWRRGPPPQLDHALQGAAGRRADSTRGVRLCRAREGGLPGRWCASPSFLRARPHSPPNLAPFHPATSGTRAPPGATFTSDGSFSPGARRRSATTSTRCGRRGARVAGATDGYFIWWQSCARPCRPRSCPPPSPQDERRGTNILLSADENFGKLTMTHIGTLEPLRGFSSFKFVPGTEDNVVGGGGTWAGGCSSSSLGCFQRPALRAPVCLQLHARRAGAAPLLLNHRLTAVFSADLDPRAPYDGDGRCAGQLPGDVRAAQRPCPPGGDQSQRRQARGPGVCLTVEGCRIVGIGRP